MGYLTTPKRTGIATTPVGIARSPYDRGSRGPIAYGGYRQPFAGAKALSMGYIVNNASALGLTSSATEELAQESKVYAGMTDAQAKLLAAQPATTPTTALTTPTTKVVTKTTPSLAVVGGGGGSSLLLLGGLVGVAAWLLFGKKSRAATASPRRRKVKRARKVKRGRRAARRNPRWPRYRKAPRIRKARSTGKRSVVIRREGGLWNVYEISSTGSIWLAGQALTRDDALQIAHVARRHSYA